MRKIGLLSDTHNYLDPLVFKHFENVDEIWHAGDIGNLNILESLERFKPTKAVYGNIDGGIVKQSCPEDLWWESEGFVLWMTHIGGYPTKYASRIKKILKFRQPDIFICGHSHILKVMKDPDFNFYVMNPGAAGREGFHLVRTLLTFNLDQKKITDLKVIEIGSR